MGKQRNGNESKGIGAWASKMIKVNGSPSEWYDGMTVQNLLDRENYSFRMLSVWINDRAVEKSAFSTQKIPDGANVQVIHNISGG